MLVSGRANGEREGGEFEWWLVELCSCLGQRRKGNDGENTVNQLQSRQQLRFGLGKGM